MVTKKKTSVQQQLDFHSAKHIKAQPTVFVPGPNPNLPTFIAEHSTPYDPKTDKYDVPAFDRDLSVHKHNKLYTLHLYWSKKDPVTISEYVKHYTQPGDIVLDAYCGSGTTGCGSQIVGCNAVLIDVSTSAAFLAYHYSLFVSPEDVQQVFESWLADGEPVIDELFATKCDRCNGPAVTEFLIWSDTYQCSSCGEIIALYDCPEATVVFPDGSKKSKPVCPHCFEKAHLTARPEFVISTRSKKYAPHVVACKYTCLGDCRPKALLRPHNDKSRKARRFFTEHDLRKAEAISLADIKLWYPKRRMMDVGKDVEVWGVKWRAGSANFQTVADLYTPRNLLALALLKEAASVHGNSTLPLLFLTWTVHKCSKLLGCGADGVGRIATGTYYMAPVRLEARPTKILEQARRQIVGHYQYKQQFEDPGDACITVEPNKDALARIVDNTIDYVFTDPPYLNVEVQYGEMNFLWDAWLNFENSIEKETTLNPIHKHSWEQAEEELRWSIAELYRVLKPNRWASICYHDTSEANWTMLQRAVLDAGFEIHTVTCLDPRSKSRKAITAEKIVKTDLVLNCRKPRFSGAQASEAEAIQISARVREILIETLSSHGGLTRDRLWDVVLRRLLARGQMAAHRFDDLLAEVALKADGNRWYLKDELQLYSEHDLANEEVAGEALNRFTLLRCAGTAAKYAAEIALNHPKLCNINYKGELNEKDIESWINGHLAKEDRDLLGTKKTKRIELGGRLAGIEFYDALFFYLTKYMKI